MKITIKTTQQKVFQVDVDSVETIADLKAKIQQSQGHPVSSQKIIYSGKILTDDKTVESCGIKEKDFLVLMVSKPKSTHVSASSASTAVASSEVTSSASPVDDPAPVSSVPLAVHQPASDTSESRVATPVVQQITPGGHGSFLSGTDLQNAITNLTEMGFPREDVLRAMRASFNNPERAVEYLMNGIPAHLEADNGRQPPVTSPPSQTHGSLAAVSPSSTRPQPQAQAPPQNLFQLAQQQQSGTATQAGAAGAGTNPGGQLNLEALRDNPQIQQLRQQMTQNPALIQPLIQQLAAQNPAMAQMIAQNPSSFFELLGLELDDGDEGHLPPGAQVINVTEEERAAIQRLESLGFSRQAALEAYIACDKNEELAANYLFESNFDD